MAQASNLDTVVTGLIKVTIQSIGSFNFEPIGSMSLRGCAGNVYVVLTGKRLIDSDEDNFFEFVSFDFNKRALIVRIRKDKK